MSESDSSPSAPKDHIIPVEHDYSDCSEDVSLISAADHGHRQSSSSDRLYQHKRRYNPLYIAVVASLTFLITDIVGQIVVAPRLAIFEQIICTGYYTTQASGAGGPEVGDCKVEPVQSELALINGWREMFDNVPGISVFLFGWDLAVV